MTSTEAAEEIKRMMDSPLGHNIDGTLEIRDGQDRVIRLREDHAAQTLRVSFEDVEPEIQDAFITLIRELYAEMTDGTDRLVVSEDGRNVTVQAIDAAQK